MAGELHLRLPGHEHLGCYEDHHCRRIPRQRAIVVVFAGTWRHSEVRPHRQTREWLGRGAERMQCHLGILFSERRCGSNPDAHADAHADPNADPNAHADTDPDPDAHAYANSDPNADPNADAHADAHADPHTTRTTRTWDHSGRTVRGHGIVAASRPRSHVTGHGCQGVYGSLYRARSWQGVFARVGRI